MGSFNETCVLSGLNIPYGTAVRMLFLTQSPSAKTRQHEAQRGCYSFDQWFPRTPPVRGKYDDYGRAEYADGPITELIAKVFHKDVVERPFGFNQYHEPPVAKGQSLDHYIRAAWSGRLLVQDDYTRPRAKPPAWPTWEKVHAAIRSAGLRLQTDDLQGDGGAKGFNAQNVLPGVVCVEFNDYGDQSKQLKKVKPLLGDYDTKLLYKFDKKQGECFLMVAAKGAFENTAILHQGDKYKQALSQHPTFNPEYRALPVLMVMAREDVWQAFLSLRREKEPEYEYDKIKTADEIYESLKKEYERDKKVKARSKDTKNKMTVGELRDLFDFRRFRDVLNDIPFMTMPAAHLGEAAEGGLSESGEEELLRATAELARVEQVMDVLHRSWHIPPLGGQEENWELNFRLNSSLAKICKKEQKRQAEDM